MEESDTMIYM